MGVEQKPAARGTIAIVVATAAVTLAIGVTVAALGGYLAPAGGGGQARPDTVAEPMAHAVQPPPSPSAPAVVLVPVTQELRGGPPVIMPAQPEPEVLLATRESGERDGEDDEDGEDGEGYHRGREHHEREHHHDDD